MGLTTIQNISARRWVWLGVTALALAGVFAIILVIARTPQLKELSLFHDLFSVALVVHVDLSVLTWFLAIIAAFISLGLAPLPSSSRMPYAEPAAFWSMAAGMICLTLSPLFGEWEVIKSNYIPVLHNAVFFLGLSLMACSVLILALEALILVRSAYCNVTPYTFWVIIMALILLLSLSAFWGSGEVMPSGYGHDAYYEYLFWAGGHTLQFAFTLIMMAAWAKLMETRYGVQAFSRRWQVILGGILLLGAIYPLSAFWRFTIDSSEFQSVFTNAMIHFGGLAPMIALVLLLKPLLTQSAPQKSRKDAALTSLLSSMALFLAGGALGLLITGQNVTIPAHYHGSIVGVTLALMGYAYVLMPQFGYGDIRFRNIAIWQPVIYAVGQLMHIGGLAYSGGYGVLRKTAVGNATFAADIKIALGFMGLGGMLAIIGGIMFVVAMVMSYRDREARLG